MPDVDLAAIEVNVGNQAILVSANVEDRETPNLIRRAKVRFDIFKGFPLSLLGSREPSL